MLKPYERLSQYYDAGWGDFSEPYIDMIGELLQERGVLRAKILDLACGTGVLAISLAKCGHAVIGIDNSSEMIRMAKSKSVGISHISFDVQDMVHFGVDGKFDVVTCTFDSVNYIRKVRDLRRMLLRVASVLDEGGLFIFDSNTKEIYQSYSHDTIRRELNGQSLLQYCSYDSAHNVVTTAFSFSDGTYEIHRQRPYDYDELSPLLDNAGLNTIHLFSWFYELPYSSNTPKLFCVAEKCAKT